MCHIPIFYVNLLTRFLLEELYNPKKLKYKFYIKNGYKIYVKKWGGSQVATS